MTKATEPTVWRKASRSSSTGGDCVEVADLANAIGIRDSKNPNAGHLELAPAAVRELVRRIKAGDLDL
ncbi:DUF397 domain-containing protein [Actinomadura miaoliensis]|uniref:DUF397 domain-containing protein n=1 Tax=Actinomadura miaoliensis TaxID=430685 RepID=A0ABP7VUJ0_9ACTN